MTVTTTTEQQNAHSKALEIEKAVNDETPKARAY
jgi:hypothetical protein